MRMWIKKYLKQIYFWGWRYRCNACDSHIRKWQWNGEDTSLHGKHQMVGSGRRASACPLCRCIDRERLILLYLQNEMNPQQWQELKVLHIAPEPAIARWLAEQKPKEYVKGDFFSQGYQYAADTVHLDIQALNWESEYFDLIICSHVLEHVADDKKAIQELNRVCRFNGMLLVMVPMALDNEVTIEGDGTEHPEFRKQHFGQFDHLRLYGCDFINRLSERNWRVSNWQFPERLANHRLNPLEYLFVGIKETI